MALINCKECGHQVSSKSRTCPSCGAIINKPKRSFLGILIKWSFILFNILMFIWLIYAFRVGAETISDYEVGAGQAGATIGLGIGVIFIVGIWVVGDIILGILTLLTRPK